MARLYKLTNQWWETQGPTKWGPGVTHGPLNGKGDLCGPGRLHAYTSPELALLLNPIHANISDPVLWEAEGEIEKSDHGLKVGTRTLTTIKIIVAPKTTLEHRVRFAIFCALEVYNEPCFVQWTKDWLSGMNRSREAAAANSATVSAAYAVVRNATTRNATNATRAAAYAAATAANATTAANAAANSATVSAAYAAAYAAATAANATRDAVHKINLDATAKRAIYEN